MAISSTAVGRRVFSTNAPDNKIHGANMGLIWGRQDPGGPHVGPMNFAIWGINWPMPTYRQSDPYAQTVV